MLAGVLVSYSAMRYGSFARKNMACYMGIYILTWFIGTVVLFISKYSGWGNIKKLGPAQYFKALYGSTLSEIWGYFFAIVLMLTVIVSLFPLIVIKNRKIYARYVLGNTLFGTIILIPLRFIDKKFSQSQGDVAGRLYDGLCCAFACAGAFRCIQIGEIQVLR